MSYRISQLAERCGVPAGTLRCYEGAGLLPAERTTAGYRVYGEEALQRLEFIASAKHLGLPLGEIRELLHVWPDGECSAVRARMLPLVQARQEEADRRSAELTAFGSHLSEVHAQLSGPARQDRWQRKGEHRLSPGLARNGGHASAAGSGCFQFNRSLTKYSAIDGHNARALPPSSRDVGRPRLTHP